MSLAEPAEFTNSIGMEMVRVEPGTFMMGFEGRPLADGIAGLRNQPSGRVLLKDRFKSGDFDESPRHRVAISRGFHISRTEVTLEQFCKFRPDFPGFKSRLDTHPYVSGVSWYDAAAFCKWLSEKEQKSYRLPTEAEWEYACRAGTETPFSSGIEVPPHETANPWGIMNMHTGPLEWVLDWHGPYPESPQTDPVGPAAGLVKVVRGGGLDVLDAATMSFYFGRDYEPWDICDGPFYKRSANRAAVPPNFAPPPRRYQELQMACVNPPNYPGPQDSNPYRAKGMVGGWHRIGFRVVEAPMPETGYSETQKPFVQVCVKPAGEKPARRPDPERPYYRTRLMFPDLTEQQMVEIGWKIGFEPPLGINQHNGGLAVLDNGDLLAVYYNGFEESSPDLSILTMRLRCGSDRWDPPSPWPDFLDGNDASPFLWNDNGKIWLGWGCPHKTGGYPFHWTVSTDNGATWGPVRFPLFSGRPGGYGRRQPINAAFRGPDRTIYVAFDGWGSTCGLWASSDEGRTWFDTGGRTFGLHSTFVLLDDDRILAYVTRNRDIDGFCPENVSFDFGKTWKVGRSPMPAQGGGQNPVMIKLASGRLFYVTDFHREEADARIEGFAGSGCYAALSGDGGQTWRVRRLVGGQVKNAGAASVEVTSIGYAGAAQHPDGTIHVVTSRNRPNLHFAFNEAWILAGDAGAAAAEAVDYRGLCVVPESVKKYRIDHPNGKPLVAYGAGFDAAGRYLLEGEETFYYESGQKQWSTAYTSGRPTGTETYWRRDGSMKWQKEHAADGSFTWTLYRSDGSVKAKSRWLGDRLLECSLRRPR
jgi:hypothetical protein